ncbi:aminotransferase class IV [Bosea sp. 117]|uniref:aminotransferase class IV n=1 Tax=Bosea sp. 117 TaxID=1125973 RepID=UPI0004941504|nr:aminotransferase class IV [Bosea sp. 117]
MTATVSVEDRGFTLGDGVFDTALALGGVMVARERHLARLLSSAQAIGIGEPGALRASVEAAVDAAVGPAPSIIRTTVTRGTAARGLWPATAGTPTVVVTTAPWSPALLGQPARLVTAGAPRNERSPTASLKSLNYLDNILAAREAAERGADDALLLNTGGRIACSTIANIFILKDGRLVTPPLREGCLPGIVRALVADLAAGQGLAFDEAPLRPSDLREADAVFLTNSLRFIRRVTALDGVALRMQATDTLDTLSAALFAGVEMERGVRP